MSHYYSTQDIADLLHQPLWHIQRIFEDGDVTETERFAGKRLIPSSQLPAIVDALRARGWLSRREVANAG
jgi:hypothetical protein